MVTAKQGLAAGALFAGLSLAASTTTGGAPPPPPRVACHQDADCGECLRCEGATELAKGVCETVHVSPDCMCDADCGAGAQGGRACSASPDKPLCGGVCVAQAGPSGLACGAGADVSLLEPFEATLAVEAAAHVVADEQLVVEIFEVRP